MLVTHVMLVTCSIDMVFAVSAPSVINSIKYFCYGTDTTFDNVFFNRLLYVQCVISCMWVAQIDNVQL